MWAWLRAAWAWFLDGHAHPAGIGGVLRNAKRGVLSWVGGLSSVHSPQPMPSVRSPAGDTHSITVGSGFIAPVERGTEGGGCP